MTFRFSGPLSESWRFLSLLSDLSCLQEPLVSDHPANRRGSEEVEYMQSAKLETPVSGKHSAQLVFQE